MRLPFDELGGFFLLHVFSLLNKIRRHEEEGEIKGKFINPKLFCVTGCDGAHPKLSPARSLPKAAQEEKKKSPSLGLMMVLRQNPTKQRLHLWKPAEKMLPINTDQDDQHFFTPTLK